MFAEGGKPKVGSESKMLGVRITPNPHADIPVDGNGNVHPETGGMSVAPAWRKLPWHLIPRRLDRRGCGHDDLVCWRFGDGDFEIGNLNDDLVLRPDPNQLDKHGVVEPARLMAIAEYQGALAATCDQWIKDES
jgi:hypothetical protein